MGNRFSSRVRLKPYYAPTDHTPRYVVSGFSRTSALLAALLATLAFAVPSSAQQTDRARTEALARRAAERLQSLQREADRLAAQERTLIGDLRKLELERQVKGEELKQFDRD